MYIDQDLIKIYKATLKKFSVKSLKELKGKDKDTALFFMDDLAKKIINKEKK